MTAEWYYVGHYGQLGPLTLEQMIELVEGGVIERDTYVWKAGMSDWSQAALVSELAQSISGTVSFMSPPPTPSSRAAEMPPPARGMMPQPFSQANIVPQNTSPLFYSTIPSDRNPVLAGLLNFIPGVGRMYLGYWAIGVLQIFVVMFTCGIGYLWPFIDGIVMMAGGVKLDGYGRRMVD